MGIDLFMVFYLGTILSGFLLGWSVYSRSSNGMRMITLYLGIVFICEVIAYILKITVRHNLVIHNISPGIYMYCLGMFFFYNIQDVALKKMVIPSFMLWIIFAIINTNFIQGWNTYPTYVFNANQMLLIFWSGMLFLEMLDRQSVHTNIFKQPEFISTIAFLWFGLASFLFYLLYNVFSKYGISTNMLHMSHYFSNIVFYLMLLTATIFEYLSIRSCQKNLSVS